MNQKSNLLEQINNVKEDYYSKNTKNFLFKKEQKIHCAKEICQKFKLSELIEKTCYFISNSSHLYFDYMMFKLYANEFNYKMIIEYILSQIYYSIKTYGDYTFHIDLNSLTVSAGERYSKFIELYISYCSNCCNERGYFVSEKLKKLYFYNPPSVMDILHKMFKNSIEIIKDKIEIVPKKESKEILDKLLSLHEEDNSKDNSETQA